MTLNQGVARCHGLRQCATVWQSMIQIRRVDGYDEALQFIDRGCRLMEKRIGIFMRQISLLHQDVLGYAFSKGRDLLLSIASQE